MLHRGRRTVVGRVSSFHDPLRTKLEEEIYLDASRTAGRGIHRPFFFFFFTYIIDDPCKNGVKDNIYIYIITKNANYKSKDNVITLGGGSGKKTHY